MNKVLILIIPVLLIAGCGSDKDYFAEGTFEATEITISSEESGKIISLDINEGDFIKADKTVGIIDTVQFHLKKLQLEHQLTATIKSRPDVEAQLSSLNTRLDNLKKEKKRIEYLLKDGAATTKQLDDINASIDLTKSNISTLKSTLDNTISSIDANSESIKTGIEQVEDCIKKCHIKSPITGTILTKYALQGELAIMGRPLFKIADLDNMFLRAYFTSSQLANIKIGQKVKVIADFGGENHYEYPGTISWISEECEFTPKSIQTKDSRSNLVYAVKIKVKNDGRIKIGFSGKVVL